MDLTYDQILSLAMQPNDAGAATIGEYLEGLLHNVWNEGEGFSGKRPFGNSGWESDMLLTLVREGVIDGAIEVEEDSDWEWGWLDWCDDDAGYQVINDTIKYAFEKAVMAY